MTPVRLSDCGDNLTLAEYSAWMRQSPNTTYAQIYSGSIVVMPWTLKPSPRWRRTDCEAQLGRRDLVVLQRKQRAKKHLGLVRAS